MLLTVLLLISINAGAMSFSDVPKNHWAYNDVKFLFDNGIIRGANFNGDENASRYYFATLIARMLETIEKGDLKVSDLKIEEYEKINRLAIEFANELNLFGYRLTKIGETLAYLRAEVEKKKREEQSEIQKVNEAKLDFTYDWRLRNDIKKFKSNNATILDENVLTQTFGINTNVNLGEGTSVFTRFEHNWGYHLFPGVDWPSSERISMFYFNFEEGTETFTVGRQFFNIANALVFSNVNNGFKYEKILNEDTDLIIGATKESLGDNSNAFSTYYVNMLKYMDESVLNYYIITSRNPAVYNATTTAMLSPNIASRVNYYGVAYRTSTYNLRYFAEAVMFDYDKTVTDNLNPGNPKKISSQLAYQLGMVKTMSPKTDMRVIYTHFDDYFKALKND
ncbi:MAG: S-layer homology domain-containing protein, partial [Candidatus Muiribacteriota bacterium]